MSKAKKIFTGILLLAIIGYLSHLLASPVGKWMMDRTSVISYEYYFGPFPGYLDGFFIAFMFLFPFAFTLFFQNLKKGLLISSPLIFLALIGSVDKWGRYSLLMLIVAFVLSGAILYFWNKPRVQQT